MNSLKVDQFYTRCLAQGAYYIVSDNEAIIIDPLRETEPYLSRLEADGVKLKYIFETHFHADFVSGHVDLSKATGAPIVYGPGAVTSFESIVAKDDQVFNFGSSTIKLLHTPGHTLESSVLVLITNEQEEIAAFTGDTLFIGDVGRPDLAQNSQVTKEDLAGMLFDSLRNKVMTLPADIIIYPAHGAGSACGKNMSDETSSTLAEQLQTNYALRADMTKQEFIREVLHEMPAPPSYFEHNIKLNKEGFSDFNNVNSRDNKALKIEEFESLSKQPNTIILDTRDPSEYYKASIPGSLNIGLNGDFAPWVGTILADVNQDILLICDSDKAEESIMRLRRVGFDRVLGFLQGGIENWKNAGKATEHVHRITPEQLLKIQSESPLKIIDVRKETEYNNSHIPEAVNCPLHLIQEWSDELDSKIPFAIHCAGGFRSMIASSILKAKGIHNFYEVEGGYKALSSILIQA
ncbi:MAG: MBL fold metallo-hydrolase [Saprospiraceae bacterium]|nr:MBL fold metallo-hydrolase [Saprospiraceae bacterium]